ncbi:hypothetical protein K0M31_009705 [Melipona bicolor]|uniref:Uncharacterized protein n=1 Tax=Melipona bicolor TaxID=60889 RepID=A0AA40FP52_9HYME|nr:hypothetical protein K0M31_009705 [Melipona bicolor]
MGHKSNDRGFEPTCETPDSTANRRSRGLTVSFSSNVAASGKLDQAANEDSLGLVTRLWALVSGPLTVSLSAKVHVNTLPTYVAL